MIAIDQVLVSDEIVEEQFVCNLSRCKGGCCEDGDAGAPLEKAELAELNKAYSVIESYMTPEGIEEVKRSGRYYYDRSFGWVTPTLNGALCAYGRKDANGVILCAIEQAYLDGKIQWKKPISCHLFPIRIKKSRKDPDIEYLNYEPRQDLCQSACSLGKELKVPVFTFVKDALIRKYGTEFFEALTAAAERLNSGKNQHD
jgi:hypothetical protein